MLRGLLDQPSLKNRNFSIVRLAFIYKDMYIILTKDIKILENYKATKQKSGLTA